MFKNYFKTAWRNLINNKVYSARNNTDNLKVTGILKDIPSNSNLHFKYIVPFDYFMANRDEGSKNWGNNSYQTFVMLQSKVTYAQIDILKSSQLR